LIDPVQVYYRRSKSEFFVPETIVDPAYAVLYVFRRDLGIGPDAFLGDGGLEVFGLPEYALIPARSVKELPFMDKEGVLRNLSPGEYGIVFATSVVWGAPRNGNNPQIDLGLSVNRFNQGDKSRRKGSRQDGERVSSSPVFVHMMVSTDERVDKIWKRHEDVFELALNGRQPLPSKTCGDAL
jgi:hypothetical protein